jgi:hypothetical protein
MCNGTRGQEGRLELEWVQQILHGAPGGGRATLRSHALATHEAEVNDGFLFVNVGQPGGGSGVPSVVADKFFVLSTQEGKRARITQTRLGEIAAALDTGGNGEEVPEWEQFAAIARGEYTDARRRKAKTETTRAQLEDEWLPLVECQPCAPVPAGTGRRGARGAGPRAGPAGRGGGGQGGPTASAAVTKKITKTKKKQQTAHQQEQQTRVEQLPERKYDG